MRKLAVAVAVLLVVGLALAHAAQTKATGKDHEVTAEVVSVDVAGKTLTIKGEDGKDKTAKVSEGALKELKTLKAGQKVTLTCHDNDKGEHEGVTAIKKG